MRADPGAVGGPHGVNVAVEFTLTCIEWLAATIVVATATLLQASIGFGVALVAAPLLYLIDPAFVPAPMIVAASAASALVYARERRAVDHAEIGRVLAGVVVGTAAAAVVLRNVTGEALGVLFGALVLVAVG